MTCILLARHGETEWNAARRIQGQMDSNLNALGRSQALQLAERLRTLPLRAIYSSDLNRALDTSAPLADALGLTVQPTPDLREKSFGEWEGQTSDEIAAADPEHWHRYHTLHEFDAPVPGGESWGQVQARMARALSQALQSHTALDDIVLLVGHGGSLRTLIADALEVPLITLRHFHLDNASVSRLDFSPPRPVRLSFLNDTSHLETAR